MGSSVAIPALVVCIIIAGAGGVFAGYKLAPTAAAPTELVDGSVTTPKLADSAVTSAKIADGAITSADIANDAVTSGKIADNSVTLEKLASSIVDMITGVENIADNSITSAKIADGAVTSAKIADGTITSDDIGSGAVTSSDIADGTITTGDLATSVSNKLGKAATKIVATDGSGDTNNIQSAINSLPAGGGAVYIREGTYTVSSSITVPSNVALIGAGAATTIYLANGANTDVITANGAQNVLIANLKINGNKANQTTTSRGIKFVNVENSKISGCWVEGGYDGGIHLEGSRYNTITGNTAGLNSGYGIYLYNSSNNTVMGNICKSNGGYGIDLYKSSNNTVMGNTCESNIYHGIALFADSNNNTITGNTCESNGEYGIQVLSGSRYNTVTGNTCESNGGHGISISDSHSNVVTGNVALNNSQSIAGFYDGINLYLADYNVITSNRCTDNQGVKTQRYGVNISNAACDKNLVVANVLIGNLTGSLNDAGTGTVSASNITV
jgi:parallel beta-helix repeat protein